MLSEVLKLELERRRERNPKYSLRSFARNLGLSPSFASKLMRGRATASSKTLEKIFQQISIGPREISVLPNHFKEKVSQARSRYLMFDSLVVSAFISGRGRCHRDELAINLGTSQERIDLALEYLEARGQVSISDGEIGLLRPSKTQGFPVGDEVYTFLDAVTERWLEEYARRPSSVVQISLPLNLSEQAQAALLAEIELFRQRVLKLAAEPGPKHRVYQLIVGSFPVSR